MSSRKNSVPTSTSGTGVQFVPASAATGGNSAALPQNDIFLTTNGGTTSNTALAGLSGKTIRGLVVGSTIEVWADGTVWDVTNNRALVPGSDFDAALLNAGGF